MAAIVLVVLGAASATPWVVTLQLPKFGTIEPSMPERPQLTLAPQEPVETDPVLAEILQRILLALLAVVAVAVAGLALFRLVRRLLGAWRPEPEPAPDDRLDHAGILGDVDVDIAALATAVARAEAHPAGHAEPGDAVTAAWVALEEEAALQGTSRDAAQTTAEFTAVLLQRTPAPADAVATLRTLYNKARFTTHPVTAPDVREARRALSRIAGALDAAVPGRTEAP